MKISSETLMAIAMLFLAGLIGLMSNNYRWLKRPAWLILGIALAIVSLSSAQGVWLEMQLGQSFSVSRTGGNFLVEKVDMPFIFWFFVVMKFLGVGIIGSFSIYSIIMTFWINLNNTRR